MGACRFTFWTSLGRILGQGAFGAGMATLQLNSLSAGTIPFRLFLFQSCLVACLHVHVCSVFLSFGMNTCRSLSLPSSLTKRLSSFSFFYPAKKLKNEPTKEEHFFPKKVPPHSLFPHKKKRAFVYTRLERTDERRPTLDESSGKRAGAAFVLLDSSSISRDRRSRRDALRAK